MKPLITQMQGSTPAGPTSPDPNNPSGSNIAADPRFGGAQSVTVLGTGMAQADAAFVGGPNGWEGCRAFFANDTSCVILPHLPVRGQYQALVATRDGQVSDPFQFTVI